MVQTEKVKEWLIWEVSLAVAGQQRHMCTDIQSGFYDRFYSEDKQKKTKMAPQLVALYMLVLSNNRCVYREWSIPCNPSETKALWHHKPLWFTLGLEEWWLSPWVWQSGVVVEGVPIYLCHPYHAAHLCWVKTEMCAVKSGSVKTCTRHESLASMRS